MKNPHRVETLVKRYLDWHDEPDDKVFRLLTTALSLTADRLLTGLHGLLGDASLSFMSFLASGDMVHIWGRYERSTWLENPLTANTASGVCWWTWAVFGLNPERHIYLHCPKRLPWELAVGKPGPLIQYAFVEHLLCAIHYTRYQELKEVKSDKTFVLMIQSKLWILLKAS